MKKLLLMTMVIFGLVSQSISAGDFEKLLIIKNPQKKHSSQEVKYTNQTTIGEIKIMLAEKLKTSADRIRIFILGKEMPNDVRMDFYQPFQHENLS